MKDFTFASAWSTDVLLGLALTQPLPVAEKTYLFRVPYYGFYI